MTQQNQELLDDVTHDLDRLRVSSPVDRGDDVSPMSDSESSSKRSKTRDDLPSRYFSTAGRIWDPLLYLRVGRSVETSVALTERPYEPPTLDEILAAGREKAKVLVERPVQRIKTTHPRGQSKAEPPAPPGPKLPVSVYRYCQKYDVRYITIPVKRTFRSITFGHSRSRTDVDPWTEYMDLNSFSHYRLCHALYFGLTVDSVPHESRVVVIVPHRSKKESQTDILKLEAALGGKVRKISLTQMEKELGFPTFVCPPFGHEFAPKLHSQSEEKRLLFFTVIDSSLVVEASTDCIFDLGIVALRLRPSELNRLSASQSWTVIERLV